jgi:hypothetical protein
VSLRATAWFISDVLGLVGPDVELKIDGFSFLYFTREDRCISTILCSPTTFESVDIHETEHCIIRTNPSSYFQFSTTNNSIFDDKRISEVRVTLKGKAIP